MINTGVKHLREFIAFAERMLVRKWIGTSLMKTVDLMIEVNRVWHEVNELRKAKPCPMHSRDFWSAMPAALFLAGDLKDSLQLYQNMYQEVKDRVNNHIGAIPRREIPVAIRRASALA